jgi:hypothetical protein
MSRPEQIKRNSLPIKRESPNGYRFLGLPARSGSDKCSASSFCLTPATIGNDYIACPGIQVLGYLTHCPRVHNEHRNVPRDSQDEADDLEPAIRRRVDIPAA